MSCVCPETNFMDGKGHDVWCPCWHGAAMKEVTQPAMSAREWVAKNTPSIQHIESQMQCYVYGAMEAYAAKLRQEVARLKAQLEQP